jgi:hypothetical protein
MGGHFSLPLLTTLSLKWVNIFSLLITYFFRINKKNSPFNLGLFIINENLTHVTFPIFLEPLNHYECCYVKVLKGHPKMGY